MAALGLVLGSALLMWPGAQGVVAPIAAAGDKLVLAFYFPWLNPTSFSSGQMSDQPVAPYDSGDKATIDRQVLDAQSAGIDAFVSSWQGVDSTSDKNFATVLDVAAAHQFKVALYFEMNFAKQHGE